MSPGLGGVPWARRCPRCPGRLAVLPCTLPYISGHVAGTAASRRAVTAGTQIPSDSPFPPRCSRLAPGPGLRGRTPHDPGLRGPGGMGTRPPCPRCTRRCPAPALPGLGAATPGTDGAGPGRDHQTGLGMGSAPWGWARGSPVAGGSAGGSRWPPCTSGSDLAHSTGLSTCRRLGPGVQGGREGGRGPEAAPGWDCPGLAAQDWARVPDLVVVSSRGKLRHGNVP